MILIFFLFFQVRAAARRTTTTRWSFEQPKNCGMKLLFFVCCVEGWPLSTFFLFVCDICFLVIRSVSNSVYIQDKCISLSTGYSLLCIYTTYIHIFKCVCSVSVNVIYIFCCFGARHFVRLFQIILCKWGIAWRRQKCVLLHRTDTQPPHVCFVWVLFYIRSYAVALVECGFKAFRVRISLI